MNFEDVKAIRWQDDGISVPYDSFYEFCIRKGFKHVVTYPFSDKPQVAFAAKTMEELNRIIAPIQDIGSFDLGS